MKRPDGFDDRQEHPAGARDAVEAGQEPVSGRGSLFARFRRGAAEEASAADADVFPVADAGAPDVGALPPLPDIGDFDEPAAGLPEQSSPAGAAPNDAGADGRTGPGAGVRDAFRAASARVGAGFGSVSSRLRPGDTANSEQDHASAPIDLFPDSHPDADADARKATRARTAELNREVRAARRRRRMLERGEVRRFTRRSRRRRIAWLTGGSVFALLVLSVLVAVYSPLMALTTISIKGTSRVNAAQVQQTLSDQLGTPLARVDFGKIKKELAGFPLIESYVTSEEPPHTLVVTITEREPIVAVKTSTGYDLVDPAGIVVESNPKNDGSFPVVDVKSTQLRSSVFRGMTEVVLALPVSVRSTVSAVSATTADDVTLTLRDGAKVVWGSPDDSDAKATLLAALIKDHAARSPGTSVEYDVSAPDNGIIRSQG